MTTNQLYAQQKREMRTYGIEREADFLLLLQSEPCHKELTQQHLDVFGIARCEFFATGGCGWPQLCDNCKTAGEFLY